MDLREYLLTMNSAGDSWNKAGDVATQLRQMDAKQKLVQDLPQLMANKDLGGLLSGGYAAGDQKLVDYAGQALAQNMMPKGNAKVKGPADVKTVEMQLAADKKQFAPQLAKIEDPDERDKAIKNVNTAYSKEQADEEINRRLLDKRLGARGDFDKRISAGFTKKLDMIDRLGVAEADPDNMTAAEMGIMLTTIAKSIGQDAGNIAVEEVKRYIPATFEGSFEKLANYLANAGDAPIPKEIREDLVNLIKKSKQKLTVANQKRAIAEIKGAYQANKERLRDGDKVDEVVQNRLNLFGLDYKLDSKGNIDIFPKKPIETKHEFSGDDAEVAMLADKIKDPAMKQHALAALAKLKGKAIPDVVKERIRKAAQGGA